MRLLFAFLQEQTTKKLRDFEALATLPPELQAVAAQRLQLNQGMLQPGMLQGHINQLRQVIQQYKMQIDSVQLNQARLTGQLQQAQQVHHHQQQQQQQQLASHSNLHQAHSRIYNNTQAQHVAHAQQLAQAHAQAQQHARAQAQAQAQQRALMQQQNAYAQRANAMHAGMLCPIASLSFMQPFTPSCPPSACIQS
jgi:chromosome segregation ATPase